MVELGVGRRLFGCACRSVISTVSGAHALYSVLNPRDRRAFSLQLTAMRLISES